MVEEIAQDDNAPPIVRLKALAVQATDASDFNKALELWSALEILVPNDEQTQFYLGWVYVYLANETPQKKAIFYLKRSVESFKKAAELNPKRFSSINNWGRSLGKLAELLGGDHAEKLFTEACEKIAEARRISPGHPSSFEAWGTILAGWANLRGCIKVDEYFGEACAKYAEADRIKPGDPFLFNAWGLALMNWALKSEGSHADAHVAEAIEKYNMADKFEPGSSAYNLACLFSLRGEFKNCLEYLEKSFHYDTLPKLGFLENDSDLDPVRDEEWFIEFLEKVCKKEEETRENRDTSLI